MDFNQSKEQIAICRSVEELCATFLNKEQSETKQKTFPKDKWRLCGQIGIQGLPVSEKYGGQGENMLTTALSMTTLAEKCNDEGFVFSLCAHICTCVIPIALHGTTEQKTTFLPKLLSGEHIGGNGMTEEGAGSDTSAIKTSAMKKDTHYCINGSKLFVSNGPVADVVIIYAKHPGGIRMADISAFIVEKSNPGLAVGQAFEKMGLDTSPLSELILIDCVVPGKNMLGRERFGMNVFNTSMIWERILMSAYHVGAMKQQYKEALSYAGSRRQFGNQLSRFTDISNKLIEMKIRLKTSELMLHQVCWNYDNGEADLADAAMLKLLASDSKIKNSIEAMQIFGAYGYMKGSPVEKQLRDSMAATIYSGTSEIQKKIIAEGF